MITFKIAALALMADSEFEQCFFWDLEIRFVFWGFPLKTIITGMHWILGIARSCRKFTLDSPSFRLIVSAFFQPSEWGGLKKTVSAVQLLLYSNGAWLHFNWVPSTSPIFAPHRTIYQQISNGTKGLFIFCHHNSMTPPLMFVLFSANGVIWKQRVGTCSDLYPPKLIQAVRR